MVGPAAMITNNVRDSREFWRKGGDQQWCVGVLEFLALERANACHHVGFWFEAPRRGFHSAPVGKSFACQVQLFVFRVFVDFRFGRYVIRCVLLSVFFFPALKFLAKSP